MDSISKAGFDSYFQNKEKYKNPYNRGTSEYNLFDRGWTQALKRSQTVKSATPALDKVPTKMKPSSMLSADAYANRKGY